MAEVKPVIVIPARFGAKRLPGKPLLEINGRPLIHHVIDRCRESFANFPLIVATDDERIAKSVQKVGVVAVMTRPDAPSGTVRVVEALASWDPDRKHEVVLHVQGDEPLVTPAMLTRLYQLIVQDTVEVATLAAPLDRPQDVGDPNVVKVVLTKDQRALYFSRLPIPYRGELSASGDTSAGQTRGPRAPAQIGPVAAAPTLGHVGLYAWKRDALQRYVHLKGAPLELSENLEQLRWLEYGHAIYVGLVDRMPRGVNTPEDVAAVASLLIER
jgi:3-deoxy-manno-octulosonate cytidylyltransferase (CMP-KDO synthetase)